MNKLYKIFLNSIPVLAMVGLIPFVNNDYLLAVLYLAIISLALFVKRERNDWKVLVTGFILMTFFEYIFLMTDAEVFLRDSFFGMPIWLPILWAYGFIAIDRAVKIIDW